MRIRPKIRNTTSSLTTTLTLAFLVFNVAALLILGGLMFTFYVKSQQTVISNNQKLVSQDAARTVTGFIKEKFSIMATTIWYEDPIALPPEKQKQFLNSLLGIQPSFRHLVLMNTQNQILARASRLSSEVSERFTGRLKQITLVQNTQRGNYISPVYIDPVTSEPMVILAVPVTNVFLDYQGSLVAEINLKFMWDLVDRLEVGESGKAYVVDRQGYLIAFGDTARVLRVENVGHLKAVDEFIHKPASAFASEAKIYSGITGDTVVGTYAPLGTPDWAVVTEVPWKEAYRVVIRTVLLSGGIFLAFSALACLLGVYLARRLASPLVHLTETATLIATGTTESLARVSGPKEVVSLARAFNSMTTQLQQSSLSLERQLVEIKKTQEALRESEQRFRTLAEASFEGIAITKQGVFHDLNSQMTQMLGYNRDELLGTLFINCVAPEHREQMVEFISNDRFEPYEHLALRKDGTVFSAETRTRLVHSGGQEFCLTAIRDITEQKVAAESLRASEEHLRNIVDHASEIIYTLSPEGNITFVSPAWTRLLGHPVTEIEGRHFTSFVHAEDVTACTEFLKRLMSTGQPQQSVEYRIKHQSGAWRWHVSVGSPVMDTRGQTRYCVGIAQDITWKKQAEEERAKLEAQLFQAQKMESIGRLAGGVAHDFNNMLNVILGHTELIKLDLASDHCLLKEMNEIEKAAGQARDITRQLLAFSRKQIISPRSININDLITDSQKTLARLIGEDINLRFYPEKDIWKTRLDPSQLNQIIFNLAVNARDAMPNGGNLTLETANINFDEAYCHEHMGFSPGSYVQLSVSDNGIGMDKETLSHLFEPFYTTKEVGKGTGLGLAMIYGSVKQNGGYINVYSELGHGTTFRIYFLRDMEESEVTEQAEEIPVLSSTGTILLVEDDEMVRSMTKMVLEKLGYNVLAPENSMEALSLCEKGDTPIDLLITDVVMPGMTGAELRNRIAAVRPEIKALFMSGYTSNAIVHHGVLHKDVHFIQKPFKINELARKVSEAVKGLGP
jgi:PAS domain S-box-containing protein